MLYIYPAIFSLRDELKYAFSVNHSMSVKEFNKHYLVQAWMLYSNEISKANLMSEVQLAPFTLYKALLFALDFL